MSTNRSLHLETIRPFVLPALVAGIFFWIAFDDGSYSLQSRATLAIGLWWTIIMAVVLGLWPLVPPPRSSLVTGGFLIAFGLWTGISIAWAASAERAFLEFDRTMLFLAVFLIAVLAGTRGNASQWANGIAVGIGGVGILALVGRLFPESLPQGHVPEFLPSAVTRINWPIEYWNGLAILIALSLPLLLRIAVGEHVVFGSIALGALPALVAAMYLTSSRGGFAAGGLGILLFCVLTPSRWPAAIALLVGLAGSAVAIAALVDRTELVNFPYDSPNAVEQGRSAALVIGLCCIGVGVAWALLSRLRGRFEIPRNASRAAAAVAVVALLAGVIAAHPIGRFEAFKEPPTTLTGDDLVKAHLLSGNGSGRWQFWVGRARPVAGASGRRRRRRLVRGLVGAAQPVLLLPPRRPLALPGDARRARHRRPPPAHRRARLGGRRGRAAPGRRARRRARC